MTKPENPTVFPIPPDVPRDCDGCDVFASPHRHLGNSGHPGMTLRDYFAGQVLAGIISDSILYKALETVAKKDARTLESVAASASYGFADAMLKERQRREGE